jgi:integrase
MGYTIQERPGVRGTSYRVLIRHHSRFLKHQETKTFKSKQEAVDYAEKYEKSLTETKKPPIPFLSDHVLPEWTTFNDLIEWYQKEIQSFKQKSTTDSQRWVIRYWQERLGNLPVPVISPTMINDGILDLMAKLKPASVLKNFTVLNCIMKFAMDKGIITVNPLAKMRKPKVRSNFKVPSPTERQRLLEAAKQDYNPNVYPMIVVSLDSACRVGELMRLKWSDIHWQNQTITFWLRKTNGENNAHTVPMSDFCTQVLIEYRESIGEKYQEDALVFQSRHKTTGSYIKHAWRRIRKESGVNIKWHGLRHLAATDVLRAGGKCLFKINFILITKPLDDLFNILNQG